MSLISSISCGKQVWRMISGGCLKYELSSVQLTYELDEYEADSGSSYADEANSES